MDGTTSRGPVGLLSRRTFSVELWVRPGTAEVATTRVVHLETGVAQAWPEWRPARLVRFIRSRLTGDAATG